MTWSVPGAPGVVCASAAKLPPTSTAVRQRGTDFINFPRTCVLGNAPQTASFRELVLPAPLLVLFCQDLLLHTLLLPLHYPPGYADAKDHAGERDQPNGPGEPMDCLAEKIAAEAKDRRPDDTPGGVVEEELPPTEAVHAGEQRREYAQDGDEPAEEYDFRAVAAKHRLSEGEPLVIDVDQPAVALEQRHAVVAADPEAHIVANDGAGGSDGDHLRDVEVPGRAGIDRGEDEGRLARHGHAGALQHNDHEDRVEAIFRDERLHIAKEHRQVGPYAF